MIVRTPKMPAFHRRVFYIFGSRDVKGQVVENG
jgi:hypothetical protein